MGIACTQVTPQCTGDCRLLRCVCLLQDRKGEVSREERLIVPFLACGDLSGYDADQSYDLPDEHYVSLDPVQPPTAPAYKDALKAKRLNQQPREQT